VGSVIERGRCHRCAMRARMRESLTELPPSCLAEQDPARLSDSEGEEVLLA
jgi:hypothetical protein